MVGWFLQNSSSSNKILELRKLSPRARQEKERVAREVESTDKQIDRLVYELSHSATLRG